MTIRLATLADCEPLFDLWLCSVRATHTFLSEPEIQALAPFVREYLAASLATLWVIDEQGMLVGFMGLNGAEIESLFIDPPFLRRGYGRRLIEHVRQGVDSLTVSVNEQNPDACRFYEACGFQVVGRSETDDAGRPYPLLHLRWRRD